MSHIYSIIFKKKTSIDEVYNILNDAAVELGLNSILNICLSSKSPVEIRDVEDRFIFDLYTNNNGKTWSSDRNSDHIYYRWIQIVLYHQIASKCNANLFSEDGGKYEPQILKYNSFIQYVTRNVFPIETVGRRFLETLLNETPGYAFPLLAKEDDFISLILDGIMSIESQRERFYIHDIKSLNKLEPFIDKEIYKNFYDIIAVSTLHSS